MNKPPWRRELSRWLHRPNRKKMHVNESGGGALSAFAVMIFVAIAVSGATIHLLEISLRPLVAEVARTQIQNHFTAVLETGLSQTLEDYDPDYGDFVSIQRGSDGEITALSTNLVLINQIRGKSIENILSELENVNVSVIQIPLGSLFDSEIFWAKGPSLQARAMTVGTVSVEFDSSFSAAGVNQTLHRIWLNAQVPVSVILPGGKIEAAVRTDFCVAETVIVGQVPNTFLQLDLVET